MSKLLLFMGLLALAPVCMAEREYVLTYSRAELTTATGVQSVYGRIVAAAAAYCPDYLQIRSRRDVQTCVDGVVADLVAKISHPGLTAYADPVGRRNRRAIAHVTR